MYTTLLAETVVTIWVQTVWIESRTCLMFASCSQYSANNTLYFSSSAGCRSTTDDASCLTSCADGCRGCIGITGSRSRLGSIYFHASPPSAIDLTTNIQESQSDGFLRVTVFIEAVIAMIGNRRQTE